MRKDDLTQEALKRLKISSAPENPSNKLPIDEMRSLEKSINEALKANASFMAQMLLLGMMFTQLLAPHVERHIAKRNEGANRNTINLTKEVQEEE